MTKHLVQFKHWHCVVLKENYGSKHGPIALQLVESMSGEPIAVATVNLEEPLPDGYCYIKDWSENEGVLQVLVDAKIVGVPVQWVSTGYCRAAVCKVLI